MIFLTCDAFGVLPAGEPARRPPQAMYHFISGYTAKVAGTEVGVTEPQATFSPCFGGPFLVWHPAQYAELLAEKMQAARRRRLAGQHRLERRRRTASGRRMKLGFTRAIIDAIHSGTLDEAPTQRDPIFGFDVVTQCPNVPSEILLPRADLARQSRLRRRRPQAGRPVP